MRPRVFPAEDLSSTAGTNTLLMGFNEAAGIPRGRRPQGLEGERAAAASMRPRVFPAEDTRGPATPCRCSCCCFNEAAGIPRGRRRGGRLAGRAGGASMRPRVFPAEDSRSFRSVTSLAGLQ